MSSSISQTPPPVMPHEQPPKPVKASPMPHDDGIKTAPPPPQQPSRPTETMGNHVNTVA